MNHFLLDIEGATVPISFVHNILFPFARQRLTFFLDTYALDPDILSSSKIEFEKDRVSEDLDFIKLFENNMALSTSDISLYFCYLIDKDRKFGPLKEIQGKIWKEGYESGKIESSLYEDVPVFLNLARQKGIACHVYSSGSVEAQKLIYQYSNYGDLRSFFINFFDTKMGGKKEAESYLNISRYLNEKPQHITFFTDIVEEGLAAQNAGMSVIILDRPGNLPQPTHNFPVLKNLLSYF